MRHGPDHPRPEWHVAVRASLEPVLDTVRAAMAGQGYRLVSLPGELPLTFRRGSVASYALLGMRLAAYSVVRVAATTGGPGGVDLRFVLERALNVPEAVEALDAVMSALVGGWSAAGVIVSAERSETGVDGPADGPLRPATDGYRGVNGRVGG